jgi:hypothetical protein
MWNTSGIPFWSQKIGPIGNKLDMWSIDQDDAFVQMTFGDLAPGLGFFETESSPDSGCGFPFQTRQTCWAARPARTHRREQRTQADGTINARGRFRASAAEPAAEEAVGRVQGTFHEHFPLRNQFAALVRLPQIGKSSLLISEQLKGKSRLFQLSNLVQGKSIGFTSILVIITLTRLNGRGAKTEFSR